MTEHPVTYAQNREDTLLANFFVGVKRGFYVDIGAHHPSFDSVTKKFYIAGWRGINVEPNKRLIKAFEIERPRDINLAVGVSNQSGSLTLRNYEDGAGLSTFSDAIKQDYSKHTTDVTRRYRDVEVLVVRLRDLLYEHAPDTLINFMKIDVEGYEYEVISSNDWNTYRPQVLCIESIHIVRDWRPLLKKCHYTFVFFDGLNDYYVADEHSELKDKFSYPQAVLAKVAIPADVDEHIRSLELFASQANQKAIHQELTIKDLLNQVNGLNAQILASKRLRSSVKQLAQALNRAMLVRIENLNKPRVRSQPTLKIEPSQKPKEILRAVQLYDLNRYYSSHSTAPLSYQVIRSIYIRFSHTVYLIMRDVMRVMRRLKNGPK